MVVVVVRLSRARLRIFFVQAVEAVEGWLVPLSLSNNCHEGIPSLSPVERIFGSFFCVKLGAAPFKEVCGGVKVLIYSCVRVCRRSCVHHFENAKPLAACAVERVRVFPFCMVPGMLGFQADRVTVIFAIDFSESDERAIAKVRSRHTSEFHAVTT